MEKIVMEKKIEFLLPDAPADTHLLSLLLPHHFTWDWISSNFINIVIDKNTYWDEFYRITTWSGCPYILDSAITRDVAEVCIDNFVKFVINIIDQGYCVWTSINRYPVELYKCNARDQCHNPLIIGYDDLERVFLVAEFLPDKIYSIKKIPFEQLECAYNMYPMAKENYPHKKIRLAKVYDSHFFEFSYRDLIYKLEEYLDAENLYKKYHYGVYRTGAIIGGAQGEQYEFGMGYYKALNELVNFDFGDIYFRPFQLLVFKNYVHKIRITHLKMRGVNLNCEYDLDSLVKETLSLRNLVLKSNVSRRNYSNELKKQLVKTEILDSQFCQKLINDLKPYM